MAIASYFYPPLAPYACDARQSKGRLIAEPPSKTRTDFHRDRDRIIHSGAFRRLKDKTQVFISVEGDHYRTRLTHSLEVAQIARSLSRGLGFDEDLAETIALAHDLGHTPFGHVGEDALHELMHSHGGFDHNSHALKIVTLLEKRYATFDGLNLTWEVLEGLVKHNGPILAPSNYIAQFNQTFDLDLTSFASGEAQAAALADDIAYCGHDVDDGLRSNFITFEQLKQVALTRNLIEEIENIYPNLEQQRKIYELSRRIITLLIEDLMQNVAQKLQLLQPKSAQEIRAFHEPLFAFTPKIQQELVELKRFMLHNFYLHPQILPLREHSKTIIKMLFNHYAQSEPDLNVVSDYIAGMTDGFATHEYEKLL